MATIKMIEFSTTLCSYAYFNFGIHLKFHYFQNVKKKNFALNRYFRSGDYVENDVPLQHYSN